MKKFLTLALIAASLFVLSCSKDKKKEVRILEGGKVELYDADQSVSELDDASQKWHFSDSRICVLYGYGFNDADFVKHMNEQLGKEFGLAEENGMILPLVYPDDFMYGKKAYINRLADKISDQNICGILLLGAPENCHTAISRIQDLHENDSFFPVISLFPQDDDVTGMEDCADLVLDHMQKAHMTGILTDSNNEEFSKSIPTIIEKAIRLEIASETPITKDSKLYSIAKELALGMKVTRYADPDTNLISINHFVIE